MLPEFEAAILQLAERYANSNEFGTVLNRIVKGKNDPKNEPILFYNIGVILNEHGKFAHAISSLLQALPLYSSSGATRNEASDCHNHLAIAYIGLGQFKHGIEESKRALAIKEELGDKEGMAICYGNLRAAFFQSGQYRSAIENERKALAIAIERGDRAAQADNHINIGVSHFNLGQFEEGIKQYEKALAIKEELRDKEGVRTCYSDIGAALIQLGQYQRAKEYQEKALAMRQS